MLTPRQHDEVCAAIRKNKLAEQEFKIIDSKSEMRATHLTTGFYFSLSPNVTKTAPASLANIILIAYIPFKVSYTPNMLNPMLDEGQPVTSGASDWPVALQQMNRWLAWIKKEYGPFEKTTTQSLLKKVESNQSMNNEQFIKKQAEEALEMAFRYSIHHQTDKVSDAIIDKSYRFHESVDRISYFDEAIRLVNDKIVEHRSNCSKGAGCYTEKKYEQIIFFLQQELNSISKPTLVHPTFQQLASKPSVVHSHSNSSMDKRYQVFISSTFTDLQDERAKVQQAVMELECIPAGMEAFPAIDEEQFEFIKKVIDDCDYYLLIIGGRYGSVSSTGISYTEMEYDYATSKGIKAIVLLHREPDSLPLKKSEQSQASKKKLEAFRTKVASGRLVKFWNNADELPGLVATSLSRTIRNYPAAGWVRGNATLNLPVSKVPYQGDDSNVHHIANSALSSLYALHPTIQQAASSLYTTGHYRQALLDAFIAVDNAVREKSQLTGSGTRLMEAAFSPSNPILKVGDSPDEQQGFLALFRGAMLAIRNPKAHGLGGTTDAQRTLEWLSFASVLLRNLDEAGLAKSLMTP